MRFAGPIAVFLAFLTAGKLQADLKKPYSGGRPITQNDPGSVRFVASPDYWNRYLIQVWQFRTDAERDLDQYRSVGIGAFHIDRGWKQEDRVAFARENQLPYYVDHAADKGLLHLTGRTGVNEILRKKELVPRPVSLSDPTVIGKLKEHLTNNVSTTKHGPVLAYSFDDEISLGAFNTPAEVDSSPATVELYRNWLRTKYVSIRNLNHTWSTDYVSWSEISPVSFEDIRKDHSKPPFSKWRLAPWMDWRSFMDTHFADVLGDLARFTNELDPRIPAGFVGAQQPSAYGGYDYNKLARNIQFIEAYDIGVTNEILRSFWSWPEKRPRVQTWFSNGDAGLDRWFHWYYLLHGNRGAIAWPDTRGHGPWFGEKGVAPFLQENSDALREVQGGISKSILAPESRFETDAIAVLYSMPSIRASWVTDVIPHGGTWPNRSSSLDNQCQSAGKNRVAWCKLLEDCGYQYNFVSNDQVAAGQLIEDGYRVLILNRALCLSDLEMRAIQRFSEAGGTVIADYWCGVLDENGNGRERKSVGLLFGRDGRMDRGYFGGGDQLCELNGEKYQLPYLERLDYENCLRHQGIVMPERAQPAVRIRESGNGREVYLNLSPLSYFANATRSSKEGEAFRKILSDILVPAIGDPTITARASSGNRDFPLIEVIRWNLSGSRQLVGLVLNPTRQGSINSIGEVTADIPQSLRVEAFHRRGWKNAINLRTGERLSDGDSFTFDWSPFEPILIECDRFIEDR